jgi:hypothetical protein
MDDAAAYENLLRAIEDEGYIVRMAADGSITLEKTNRQDEALSRQGKSEP